MNKAASLCLAMASRRTQIDGSKVYLNKLTLEAWPLVLPVLQAALKAASDLLVDEIEQHVEHCKAFGIPPEITEIHKSLREFSLQIYRRMHQPPQPGPQFVFVNDLLLNLVEL